MYEMQAAAGVFGRGTAAGDAIYKCYVRPTKESTLDRELLERLQKMRQEKAAAEAAIQRPRPVPKSKAMINCPRVGLGHRMSDWEKAMRRLIALPHKKPASVIQQELRASCPPLPPLCKRPPITVEEKERLAQIFQLGKLPLIPKKFTGVNRARYAQIDKRFRLKDRFEKLTSQVESLREELRKIRELNKAFASDESLNIENLGYDIQELGDDSGRRARKRNMIKVVENCMVERELTKTIGEVLQEMRIIDADIRQLEKD